MPSWTPIALDYEPLPGSNDVFISAKGTFDANSIAKDTPARNSKRQAHFENQVKNIAWHLGSRTVPVFLEFNGEQRRMDKGCIGLAITAGGLERPVNGPDGYVTHVTLTIEPT